MPREAENVVLSTGYTLDRREGLCNIDSPTGETWPLPKEVCEKPRSRRVFLPAAKLALRTGKGVEECYVLLQQSRPRERPMRFRLLGEVPDWVCETDELLMERRGWSEFYDEETGAYISARELVSKMREEGGLVWSVVGPV